MLHLSRVSQAEMQWREVDLSAMAAEMMAEHRRSAPERDVDCVVAEGAVVQGDAKLLRIALQNLIDNAFKFTRKKPRARIEFGVLTERGAKTYFVRDDGAGFDMQFADKLFGTFQRMHDESEFEGTGIGLATVRRIVSKHGGQIRAEGEVGRGATFYFTL
jgi:light-regulated signal transduction histidine kinase (bacteriophytochrome)